MSQVEQSTGLLREAIPSSPCSIVNREKEALTNNSPPMGRKHTGVSSRSCIIQWKSDSFHDANSVVTDIWHPRTLLALVQGMAYHLLSWKPLPAPKLTYWDLLGPHIHLRIGCWPSGTMFSEIWIRKQYFSWKKFLKEIYVKMSCVGKTNKGFASLSSVWTPVWGEAALALFVKLSPMCTAELCASYHRGLRENLRTQT